MNINWFLLGLCIRIIIMEHLILIPKDVVVHIVLLRRLRGQDKRLHETPHWQPIVRQLTSHLKIVSQDKSVTLTSQINYCKKPPNLSNYCKKPPILSNFKKKIFSIPAPLQHFPQLIGCQLGGS